MPNTGTAVKSKAATQTKIISEQVDEFTEAMMPHTGKTQEGSDTYKGTRTINYGRVKASEGIKRVGFTGGYEEGRLKKGGQKREYAFQMKAGREATAAQKEKYGTTLRRMERSASRGPMERALKRRKVIQGEIEKQVDERVGRREAEMRAQMRADMEAMLNERLMKFAEDKQRLAEANDAKLAQAAKERVDPNDTNSLEHTEEIELEEALERLPKEKQRTLRMTSPITQAYILGVREKTEETEADEDDEADMRRRRSRSMSRMSGDTSATEPLSRARQESEALAREHIEAQGRAAHPEDVAEIAQEALETTETPVEMASRATDTPVPVTERQERIVDKKKEIEKARATLEELAQRLETISEGPDSQRFPFSQERAEEPSPHPSLSRPRGGPLKSFDELITGATHAEQKPGISEEMTAEVREKMKKRAALNLPKDRPMQLSEAKPRNEGMLESFTKYHSSNISGQPASKRRRVVTEEEQEAAEIALAQAEEELRNMEKEAVHTTDAEKVLDAIEVVDKMAKQNMPGKDKIAGALLETLGEEQRAVESERQEAAEDGDSAAVAAIDERARNKAAITTLLNAALDEANSNLDDSSRELDNRAPKNEKKKAAAAVKKKAADAKEDRKQGRRAVSEGRPRRTRSRALSEMARRGGESGTKDNRKRDAPPAERGTGYGPARGGPGYRRTMSYETEASRRGLQALRRRDPNLASPVQASVKDKIEDMGAQDVERMRSKNFATGPRTKNWSKTAQARQTKAHDREVDKELKRSAANQIRRAQREGGTSGAEAHAARIARSKRGFNFQHYFEEHQGQGSRFFTTHENGHTLADLTDHARSMYAELANTKKYADDPKLFADVLCDALGLDAYVSEEYEADLRGVMHHAILSHRRPVPTMPDRKIQKASAIYSSTKMSQELVDAIKAREIDIQPTLEALDNEVTGILKQSCTELLKAQNEAKAHARNPHRRDARIRLQDLYDSVKDEKQRRRRSFSADIAKEMDPKKRARKIRKYDKAAKLKYGTMKRLPAGFQLALADVDAIDMGDIQNMVQEYDARAAHIHEPDIGPGANDQAYHEGMKRYWALEKSNPKLFGQLKEDADEIEQEYRTLKSIYEQYQAEGKPDEEVENYARQLHSFSADFTTFRHKLPKLNSTHNRGVRKRKPDRDEPPRKRVRFGETEFGKRVGSPNTVTPAEQKKAIAEAQEAPVSARAQELQAGKAAGQSVPTTATGQMIAALRKAKREGQPLASLPTTAIVGDVVTLDGGKGTVWGIVSDTSSGGGSVSVYLADTTQTTVLSDDYEVIRDYDRIAREKPGFLMVGAGGVFKRKTPPKSAGQFHHALAKEEGTDPKKFYMKYLSQMSSDVRSRRAAQSKPQAMPQNGEQIDTKSAVDVAREEAGMGTDKKVSAAISGDKVLSCAAVVVSQVKGAQKAVVQTQGTSAKKKTMQAGLSMVLNQATSLMSSHVASQKLVNSNHHHMSGAINDNRARQMQGSAQSGAAHHQGQAAYVAAMGADKAKRAKVHGTTPVQLTQTEKSTRDVLLSNLSVHPHSQADKAYFVHEATLLCGHFPAEMAQLVKAIEAGGDANQLYTAHRKTLMERLDPNARNVAQMLELAIGQQKLLANNVSALNQQIANATRLPKTHDDPTTGVHSPRRSRLSASGVITGITMESGIAPETVAKQKKEQQSGQIKHATHAQMQAALTRTNIAPAHDKAHPHATPSPAVGARPEASQGVASAAERQEIANARRAVSARKKRRRARKVRNRETTQFYRGQGTAAEDIPVESDSSDSEIDQQENLLRREAAKLDPKASALPSGGRLSSKITTTNPQILTSSGQYEAGAQSTLPVPGYVRAPSYAARMSKLKAKDPKAWQAIIAREASAKMPSRYRIRKSPSLEDLRQERIVPVTMNATPHNHTAEHAAVTAGVSNPHDKLPHFNHARGPSNPALASTHAKHHAAAKRQHARVNNLAKPFNASAAPIHPVVTRSLEEAHRAVLGAKTDKEVVALARRAANNFQRMPFTADGHAILKPDLTMTAPLKQTADALRKSSKRTLEQAAKGETRTLTEKEYRVFENAMLRAQNMETMQKIVGDVKARYGAECGSWMMREFGGRHPEQTDPAVGLAKKAVIEERRVRRLSEIARTRSRSLEPSEIIGYTTSATGERVPVARKDVLSLVGGGGPAPDKFTPAQTAAFIGFATPEEKKQVFAQRDPTKRRALMEQFVGLALQRQAAAEAAAPQKPPKAKPKPAKAQSAQAQAAQAQAAQAQAAKAAKAKPAKQKIDGDAANLLFRYRGDQMGKGTTPAQEAQRASDTCLLYTIYGMGSLRYPQQEKSKFNANSLEGQIWYYSDKPTQASIAASLERLAKIGVLRREEDGYMRLHNKNKFRLAYEDESIKFADRTLRPDGWPVTPMERESVIDAMIKRNKSHSDEAVYPTTRADIIAKFGWSEGALQKPVESGDESEFVPEEQDIEKVQEEDLALEKEAAKQDQPLGAKAEAAEADEEALEEKVEKVEVDYTPKAIAPYMAGVLAEANKKLASEGAGAKPTGKFAKKNENGLYNSVRPKDDKFVFTFGKEKNESGKYDTAAQAARARQLFRNVIDRDAKRAKRKRAEEAGAAVKRAAAEIKQEQDANPAVIDKPLPKPSPAQSQPAAARAPNQSSVNLGPARGAQAVNVNDVHVNPDLSKPLGVLQAALGLGGASSNNVLDLPNPFIPLAVGGASSNVPASSNALGQGGGTSLNVPSAGGRKQKKRNKKRRRNVGRGRSLDIGGASAFGVNASGLGGLGVSGQSGFSIGGGGLGIGGATGLSLGGGSGLSLGGGSGLSLGGGSGLSLGGGSGLSLGGESGLSLGGSNNNLGSGLGIGGASATDVLGGGSGLSLGGSSFHLGGGSGLSRGLGVSMFGTGVSGGDEKEEENGGGGGGGGGGAGGGGGGGDGTLGFDISATGITPTGRRRTRLGIDGSHINLRAVARQPLNALGVQYGVGTSYTAGVATFKDPYREDKPRVKLFRFGAPSDAVSALITIKNTIFAKIFTNLVEFIVEEGVRSEHVRMIAWLLTHCAGTNHLFVNTPTDAEPMRLRHICNVKQHGRLSDVVPKITSSLAKFPTHFVLQCQFSTANTLLTSVFMNPESLKRIFKQVNLRDRHEL